MNTYNLLKTRLTAFTIVVVTCIAAAYGSKPSDTPKETTKASVTIQMPANGLASR